MIPNPARIRARVRKALCHLGRQMATVYRPDRDEFGGILATRTEIGRVAGYPYNKARQIADLTIALPGQLDENDREDRRYLVLYGCTAPETDIGGAYTPPTVERGDVLVFENGSEYRIQSARDVIGAYWYYVIEEM